VFEGDLRIIFYIEGNTGVAEDEMRAFLLRQAYGGQARSFAIGGGRWGRLTQGGRAHRLALDPG
jgi:hypothetical protein